MNKKIDFLSIGDITIDAFIRLKEAEVHCDLNHDTCMLSMRFADKIPYENVYVVNAVGNSPNASVSASRLGLSAGLITNLGNDRNGDDCVQSLKKDGIDISHVTQHKDSPTNYHYVLWYQSERTILVKHNQYQYKLPNFEEPRLIYLSSLGEHTEEYHNDIAKYLKSHREVMFVFQPGTYQMKAGTDRMIPFYKRADILFCNKEEAGRILKTESKDITDLLDRLHALGPKRVIITDGPRGAYGRDINSAIYFVPIYPDPKPVLERTGAGDAFSSTVSSAFLHGMNMQEAMLWGPVNSMSVVQDIGAQKGLLTLKKLQELLSQAPISYRIKKVRE